MRIGFVRKDRRVGGVAFTLIELLLVIVIMALLLTFLVPAITGPLSATKLTSAASNVASELQAARQVAVTRNVEVEVHFYSEEDGIRRFATYRLLDDGTREPIVSPSLFPNGIVISEDMSLTKIGAAEVGNAMTLPDSIPEGTSFYSFSFFSDGSTDLDLAEKWFLTVVKEGQAGLPPKNFATIQIGPLTGSVKVHRP